MQAANKNSGPGAPWGLKTKRLGRKERIKAEDRLEWEDGKFCGWKTDNKAC